jgi:hypothetical protein
MQLAEEDALFRDQLITSRKLRMDQAARIRKERVATSKRQKRERLERDLSLHMEGKEIWSLKLR